MQVLIAPDSFGGTLTAHQAADAVAAGWRSVNSEDGLDLAPISDGGPGFLDVLTAAVRGVRHAVATTDPLGRPIDADILLTADTAYVESALACGLHLLAPAERDPERVSSAGVGALLAAAAASGRPRIVVGLGGSGTNDGGEGALAALVPATRTRLAACTLLAATDVDAPLLGRTGASAVFGPQKGADRAAVQRLDLRLEQFARRLAAEALAARSGAGAAGGLGFALLYLGAELTSGVALVAGALDLPRRVARADLVITGEGRYDEQSLRGKAPSGVAALAAENAVPCVVLAGALAVGRRQAAAHGITEMHALVDTVGPERALGDSAASLVELAARVARQWSPPDQAE